MHKFSRSTQDAVESANRSFEDALVAFHQRVKDVHSDSITSSQWHPVLAAATALLGIPEAVKTRLAPQFLRDYVDWWAPALASAILTLLDHVVGHWKRDDPAHLFAQDVRSGQALSFLNYTKEKFANTAQGIRHGFVGADDIEGTYEKSRKASIKLLQSWHMPSWLEQQSLSLLGTCALDIAHGEADRLAFAEIATSLAIYRTKEQRDAMSSDFSDDEWASEQEESAGTSSEEETFATRINGIFAEMDVIIRHKLGSEASVLREAELQIRRWRTEQTRAEHLLSKIVHGGWIVRMDSAQPGHVKYVGRGSGQIESRSESKSNRSVENLVGRPAVNAFVQEQTGFFESYLATLQSVQKPYRQLLRASFEVLRRTQRDLAEFSLEYAVPDQICSVLNEMLVINHSQVAERESRYFLATWNVVVGPNYGKKLIRILQILGRVDLHKAEQAARLHLDHFIDFFDIGTVEEGIYKTKPIQSMNKLRFDPQKGGAREANALRERLDELLDLLKFAAGLRVALNVNGSYADQVRAVKSSLVTQFEQMPSAADLALKDKVDRIRKMTRLLHSIREQTDQLESTITHNLNHSPAAREDAMRTIVRMQNHFERQVWEHKGLHSDLKDAALGLLDRRNSEIHFSTTMDIAQDALRIRKLEFVGCLAMIGRKSPTMPLGSSDFAVAVRS
ncbi:hypothetical protein OIO90_001557 [Microbotryomycetes sp. JL221]|nr:hypothetical protein OIO90_001557 [Microbotryomycetes sp. JL221]